MVPTLIALASCVVALGVQLAYLSKRDRILRAKEQAFQFHALRDELQLFVVQERMHPSALTYEFLMQMLNFSIKNAGVLKLREALALTEKVKERVDETRFEAILADVKKHDPEVQELTGKFFLAFANMLVSNDWIVRAGVGVARRVATGWKVLGPIIRMLDTIATAFFRLVTPIRVEAVHEVRRYRIWARCASPQAG